METTAEKIPMSDGEIIYRYKFKGDGEPKGIVHITHGMAEHAARYGRFAETLTAQGYVVFADDHRAHGQSSALSHAALGHAAHGEETNAFDRMVEDTHELLINERDAYPGLPLILLGHSMGSVIAQHVAGKYGHMLAGLILSGVPARPNAFMGFLYRVLANTLLWWHGPTGYTTVIRKLTFDEFNRQFAPNRTNYDWLSQDEVEVDKYKWDPHCGQAMSVGFWHGFLLHGVIPTGHKSTFHALPATLPVHVMVGERDPCHNKLAALPLIRRTLAQVGHDPAFLSELIYPTGRHEILNELEPIRNQVTADIVAWLEMLGRPAAEFMVRVRGGEAAGDEHGEESPLLDGSASNNKNKGKRR